MRGLVRDITRTVRCTRGSLAHMARLHTPRSHAVAARDMPRVVADAGRV